MTGAVAPPVPVLRYVERSRLAHTASGASGDLADSPWLDVMRFLFDRDITDESTLYWLLRNAYYRDDYLDPSRPFAPRGTRHGPYRLDCLTTDAFELIDRPSAEETLSRWAEETSRAARAVPPATMHAAARIIAAATTTYHLKDLRDTCEHEDGRRLGAFHELVLLNRHDGILTVLIASRRNTGA